MPLFVSIGPWKELSVLNFKGISCESIDWKVEWIYPWGRGARRWKSYSFVVIADSYWSSGSYHGDQYPWGYLSYYPWFGCVVRLTSAYIKPQAKALRHTISRHYQAFIDWIPQGMTDTKTATQSRQSVSAEHSFSQRPIQSLPLQHVDVSHLGPEIYG